MKENEQLPVSPEAAPQGPEALPNVPAEAAGAPGISEKTGKIEKTESSENPGEQDLEAQARRLITQAETIRDLTGADVFQRYLTDAEAHRRVLSGEWDFRNVLQSMAGETDLPPVVRCANGGSAGIRVKSMSESQFRRFDEALERGEVIDMRM